MPNCRKDRWASPESFWQMARVLITPGPLRSNTAQLQLPPLLLLLPLLLLPQYTSNDILTHFHRHGMADSGVGRYGNFGGGEKMREFWVWTRERVFGKPGGDKRKGSRETTTPVKVCGCMESVITGGYSFENSTVTSVRRVLWFPQRLIPSYLLVRSVSLFYIRSHPLYLRLPSIFCRCCKRAR